MDLSETVLFRDDFSEMEVGAHSVWPVRADGEQHVVDRTFGEWIQPIIHYSWEALASGNWKVLEEDGRHVMVHSQRALKGPPMLIRGSRFLRDYALEADIRPMSFEGACGLLVRFQDGRRYVSVRITRGMLALIRCSDGGERYLATRGHAFDVDRYYRLSVACVGERITVSLDGEPMLEGREKEFSRGPVGLWSQAPARFADVVLTTSRSSENEAAMQASAWEADEHTLQSALPKPVLWKKIPTPGFGTDHNLQFGDLDGDGELEMVMTQRVDLTNADFPSICCITAVDLDGNVLWQRGETNAHFVPNVSETCFRVYDIDGDGRDEVLFCKDLRLWVADGRTGEIIRSAPTPRAPTHTGGGRPLERILGDAIHIANLTGGDHPSEILLKDRYCNMWALDSDLNVLWYVECNTGHDPVIYDIDGDGCDEIMSGYAMIDQDGSLLWDVTLPEHADAVAIAPTDPDHPEHLMVGIAASDGGFAVLTAQGEMLSYYGAVGHAQAATVANLRPDLPGLEFATITFWGAAGIIYIFDSRGKMLNRFMLNPYAGTLAPVNWTGDGQEFLILSGHPTEGGLIDAYGHRVVMFPDDGHPAYCYKALDLTGDGRDELLTWDLESIWIYRADIPLPEGKRYRPIRRPRLYNMSNYTGRVSIPHWD